MFTTFGFAHPGLAEPRTKEEWRAYLAMEAPQCPVMPSYEDYLRIPALDREELNDERDIYHSALELVRTQQIRRLHAAFARRMKVNRRQAPGARRGIVLDGPPTIGKSTLVKLFAKDFELQLRARHPEKFSDTYEVDGYLVDYTPVVYLNIPSQATPKDLSVLLAEYLGMPMRSGATKTEVTNGLLKNLKLAGTELVIIDDVHFLDLSAKEGKVVNDHLKYLANHIAATFIYTGADLNTSGLFLEGKGSTRATQTSGRNTLHQMRKFGTTKAEKVAWVEVVAALEGTLALYRHRQGQLAALSPYLYERTGGSICGLSDLIRESAIEAVTSGEEAITEELMETIQLSQMAELAYQEAKPKQGKTRPKAQAAASVS
ncbi:TniB family NTP-binding protein [Kitasatospora sp. NPDC004723]|uniref:TniB family NTP-binding protein n=1 Tax=Kitasatospora sp. NPDC004723 TaxID=3154288 RepID=UPI0033A14A5A